jgi:hypothetical protein
LEKYRWREAPMTSLQREGAIAPRTKENGLKPFSFCKKKK